MRKLTFSILIFTMTVLSTFAQTEATTNDGKKVILNDDGTWKYAEAKTENTEPTDNSDCSNYIDSEENEYGILSSKGWLVVSRDGGETGFAINFLKLQEGSIAFSFEVVGAGPCIEKSNKMNVLFRDGTRIELAHDGELNCEAKYRQFFLGQFGRKKELEMFRKKEVETMRIYTSDGYVEEDFSTEESKEFLHTVDCLMMN